MKTIRWCLSVALIMTSLGVRAEDLSQHVFFKLLIGKWSAEGALIGKDNNTITIKEEWEGKATAEGGFEMNGWREINENRQTFRWLVTRNPATQQFEVVHVVDGDEANATRFEGNVSEVNLTMELKTITGSNSSITVADAFKGDAKDEIESLVTFIGDDGATNLSGKITHKRMK